MNKQNLETAREITILSGSYEDYSGIFQSGTVFVRIMGQLSNIKEDVSFMFEDTKEKVLSSFDAELTTLKKVETIKSMEDFDSFKNEGFVLKVKGMTRNHVRNNIASFCMDNKVSADDFISMLTPIKQELPKIGEKINLDGEIVKYSGFEIKTITYYSEGEVTFLMEKLKEETNKKLIRGEAEFEDEDVVVKDNFATIKLLGKQMPAPDWTKPSFTIKKEGETEIETEIVNCTPHSISIQTGEGKTTTFEVSGIVPRVSTEQVEAPEIAGFPCVTSKTGDVEELPAQKSGTFYIVSSMVFSASDRADLIAPDTGKTAIRNEKGHIIAVTRFLRK